MQYTLLGTLTARRPIEDHKNGDLRYTLVQWELAEASKFGPIATRR